MKTAVVSFNSKGHIIADKLNKLYEADLYKKNQGETFNISELTKRLIEDYEAIIFISSTGIAVRAIAPFIKNKEVDPAVLVIDVFGKYVISLLSGHLGGANALTLKLSEYLSAEPIITTATDSLGIKAPDILAKENGLIIDNMKAAKDIAALLVDDKKAAFIDDDNLINLPRGYTSDLEDVQGVVVVGNKAKDKNYSALKVLKLIRKNIILGIGCRKDYPVEKMKDIVLQKLAEYNIDKRAVKAIATIEIKKDEKAILALSKYLDADLKIFTKAEIEEAQNKYKGSNFVFKSVGVRAVCEPCTELCGAKLQTGKLCIEGMTLCIGKV
ncbi:cobalt-precorrin 5A hydrolase [Candidatus Clostridium radicumherbarum]|uniref:Cobalt-precorrin 5A hydrolase n=1 Tax=Candidatus Clostridium radicumherbarum TaxID=3381662 RepID=A0ABW8TSG1_9CLOT